MSFSDPEWLELQRGPIDGRKFFSRSPFRSGYFLIATAVSWGCVVLVLRILLRHWPHLPSGGVVILSLIVMGIAQAWVRGYRYIDRLRQLYSGAVLTHVEAGSPLDIALGVAAGVTNNLLFYSLTTLALSLVYVDRLLGP